MRDPILITGTPRSGKTCVFRLFTNSDEFACANEPLLRWAAPGRQGLGDCRDEIDASVSVCRSIKRDCESFVARSGKARYCDNLSYHALRVPFVMRVLPGAKIIHVVRDPYLAIPEMMFGWKSTAPLAGAVGRLRGGFRLRACARAALRYARNRFTSSTKGRRSSWGPSPAGLDEWVRRFSLAEVVARQWVAITSKARTDLHDLHGEHTLEVRHERLISNPRFEARRIAHFSGVEQPDALEDYAGLDLRSDYVHHEENWYAPTPDEWEVIGEVAGPLRRILGYQDS